MILYSIIPPELVFSNFDDNSTRYIEVEYMGERVLVSQLQNNRYVINRLISTSPKAYLNPRLQPGSIIEGAISQA